MPAAAMTASGLCECGCGGFTPIATVTSRKRGYVKGQPIRFIRGHSVRITNKDRRGVERVEILTEHRGYFTPCHIWQGFADRRGYGSRGDGNGRIVTAHRFAYEREHGRVPPGMEIHHLCEQKSCVNPDHLVAMTRQQHVWLHRMKEAS